MTLHDLLSHMRYEEALGALGYAEVIDFSGATTVMSSADVRSLADETVAATRTATELGPTYIIADSDLIFGLSRMYAILCDNHGITVEVYRQLSETSVRIESWCRRTHRRG